MSKTGIVPFLLLVILLEQALEISLYACLRHGLDNEYDNEQGYDNDNDHDCQWRLSAAHNRSKRTGKLPETILNQGFSPDPGMSFTTLSRLALRVDPVVYEYQALSLQGRRWLPNFECDYDPDSDSERGILLETSLISPVIRAE